MQAIGRQPQRAPGGAPVHYERHRPEQTTLYRLVQQHAATFIREAEAEAGRRPSAVRQGRVRRVPRMRHPHAPLLASALRPQPLRTRQPHPQPHRCHREHQSLGGLVAVGRVDGLDVEARQQRRHRHLHLQQGQVASGADARPGAEGHRDALGRRGRGGRLRPASARARRPRRVGRWASLTLSWRITVDDHRARAAPARRPPPCRAGPAAPDAAPPASGAWSRGRRPR